MATKIPNFRLFLHQISDELVTDELESLKFLCNGILTKARLEKITNARDLFMAIGEVVGGGEDEQLDFIKELLAAIKRLDLAVQVEEFQSKRTGLVHNNSVQTPLQPNPSHSVFPDNQDEAPVFQSGSSVWPSQGPSLPSLAASYQVTGNLPQGPVNLTGNASLYGNDGFQQALDLVQNLLRNNNPTAQPGSGVRSPEAHQPSRFSTTDSQPSYQVQNSSSGSEVNPTAHVHPAGLNRNPEEQLKPPNEQKSTWEYRSQYSVPFGQQEQSPDVTKDEESRQWKYDDKIEVVNLPELSQSAPQWEEQKLQSAIQEVNLSDHPQSSPGSFIMENLGEDRAGNDKITPENSSDLSQFPSNSSMTAMEPSGEVSGDLSQGNISANSQDSKENLDNTDYLRGRVRSWTDGGSTASTSSDRHHRISQPGSDKRPVERVMSHNCDVEQAQHLHHKCPVEMSYECISKYFSRGKNLGQGGFGTVYEGTRTFHDQSVVVKEEHSYHLGQAYSAAQLQREKRVGYIKHPHLMPLYAFCEEKGKPRCLMYPKMHNDLHKALRKDLTGHTKLPWENRVRIALHTARALLYLHTEVTNERNVRQEIVHMDVKPGNIFLDADFNARLGDPGMAQELPMEHSYASISQIRGTEGYMDEYQRDRHFKPVNDIFSYGVVLLQLLTQRKAMVRKPQNKNAPLCRVLKEEGVLADPEQLMEKAQKGVWPDSEGDKQYTKEFAAIAIECLKPPEERAKLSDVCQRLEEILERKGFSKASKPKEGAGCVSCLLNSPAKHLGVRSTGCDRNITEECNYFCARCLSQARRNPLECPSHGPAEPPIGRSNIYAVLVCGNDPNSPKATAVFERDLLGFKSVLTDSRIVGVRRDHIYTITPLSTCGMSQADLVRQALHELKDKLQGKKDVFLYFYFSGHSDQLGNLLCSSDTDLLTEADLKEHFKHLNVDEILIILDCCFADGKIASEHIRDESFLVHKSPFRATETELQQHPLESLCSNLQDTAADENSTVPTGEPSSNATEELPNTGFDVLDGNVFNKAPLVSFTVRQWSSSLSQQLSYAKAKGSFLTQYIICGLRGAHECPFSNCSSCDTFRTKAKSLGYIAAGDLENFFSTHVEKAALAAGGFRQNPRIRTVRSRETKLAFYNDQILRDEIIFKSFTSGLNERITIDKFPFSLLQFQSLVFSKVRGHLPTCAQPKHLQILCDDQEIDATSYVDLQEFLRQGYDVRCQLRPCSGVVHGPVVVQIQNYKDQVITLLTLLRLTRNQHEDLVTFEMDTSKVSCTAEDVRECYDDQPSLSELKDTQVARSVVMILTEASLYIGCLTICVSDDSLDCCFTKALN